MRIGILGGSFNPIHKGHIMMVLEAIKILKLDRIIVVPVGIPSHRNSLLNGDERVKMCRLAFSSKELSSLTDMNLEDLYSKIQVSDIEVMNSGISYTYTTLLKIKESYPKDEIFEIIGEDSANNFSKWRNYKEILNESKVAVFRRVGKENLIPKEIKERMIFLDTPYFQYSSTTIRDRLKKGHSIDEMTVEEVKRYIEENRFYKE